MGIRFEKVLEQVATAANAKSETPAIESQERKVRRLEEMIRAREAMGDRIAICLGLALALSAVALPVYAIHFSNGAAYLQSIQDNLVFSKDGAMNVSRPVEGPATTGSLLKEAKGLEQNPGNKDGSNASSQSGAKRLQPYIIHKATAESALIEGPDGLWWVTPGMTLPGIGQVLSIERSDNGWIVMTSETMITQLSSKGTAS